MSSFKLRWSLALIMTFVGYFAYSIVGPFPVYRGSLELDFNAPYWYMVSAFPVLGLFMADVWALWKDHRLGLPTVELAIMLALMTFLSIFRISLKIPLSGHALLFGYFLLRRLIIDQPPVPFRKFEVALGVFLIVALAVTKLFWWNDPITLIIGLLIGGFLALISMALSKKH